MKKTLLIMGLTVVGIAGIAAFLALQGHKKLHGTQGKAVSTAPVTRDRDLASSPLCNYSIPSVATQAKAIADSVPVGIANRDLKIATATRDWVTTHIGFQSQSATSPADVTLRSREGNDASESVLIAAMMRSDGIPAEVQLVPEPSTTGYFADKMPLRYVVMAWPTPDNGLELDTEYQHRQPQPLTDCGTLPW